MDFNLPCFTEYESAFQSLAESVTAWEGTSKPVLTAMKTFLCLYGDNGMTPEAEFDLLAEIETTFQQTPEKVAKLEIDVATHYWQETILFILP
jgi:hypothetical protein